MDALNFDTLTAREKDIATRIIDGKSTREIARDLGIGVKTVETHRSKINKKLEVHSPAELIRRAFVDKEPARPDDGKSVTVLKYKHGEDVVVPSKYLSIIGPGLDGKRVRVTVEPADAS